MGTEYNKLMEQIRELQAKAEQARRSEINEGIAKIHAIMDELDISVDDIRRVQKKKPGNVTSVVKYINEDGQTWTGRGKPPRWILAAEEQGRQRSEFEVRQPAPAE